MRQVHGNQPVRAKLQHRPRLRMIVIAASVTMMATKRSRPLTAAEVAEWVRVSMAQMLHPNPILLAPENRPTQDAFGIRGSGQAAFGL